MTQPTPDTIAETVFGFWSSRAFRSAKTPEVVQAETRLHEDWLSIVSLDENVVGIRAVAAGLLGEGESPDFEVAEHGGGSHLVFLMPSDATPERRSGVLSAVSSAGRKGLDCRVVDEVDVMREPRLRNVRLIYGCRRTRVSPTDRMQILHHLTEHGRSNLLEAARCVRGSPEAAECVLALVTEGTVMVDVERTLGPEMPVWRLRTPADEDGGFE